MAKIRKTLNIRVTIPYVDDLKNPGSCLINQLVAGIDELVFTREIGKGKMGKGIWKKIRVDKGK